MKLKQVIDRLREIFPDEMDSFRYLKAWSKNELDIMADALNIALFFEESPYEYEEINGIYDMDAIVTKYSIHSIEYSLVVYGNISDIFSDILEIPFTFSDFISMRDFVETHSTFPKTVYVDQSSYIYRFQKSDVLFKIDDITKVDVETHYSFVERTT